MGVTWTTETAEKNAFSFTPTQVQPPSLLYVIIASGVNQKFYAFDQRETSNLAPSWLLY